MQIEGLFVVTLWAADVSATAHFYRDVMGLQMLPHHGQRSHFRLGDTLLTIMKSDKPVMQEGRGVRFPALALRVADLDAAASELAHHNVAMPWSVDEDADSRW